jgi:hypothetical protein
MHGLAERSPALPRRPGGPEATAWGGRSSRDPAVIACCVVDEEGTLRPHDKRAAAALTVRRPGKGTPHPPPPGLAAVSLGRARPRGRRTCAPLPSCQPSQEQIGSRGQHCPRRIEIGPVEFKVSDDAAAVEVATTNAESTTATTTSRWASAKTATTTTSRAPRMRRRGRDLASQKRSAVTVPHCPTR